MPHSLRPDDILPCCGTDVPHALDPRVNPRKLKATTLRNYDFIVLLECFDESMVALAMLLQVPREGAVRIDE